MQVGPSRELFELWAPDSRNGLIVTGYSIEGTLSRVSAKWFGLVIYLLYIDCDNGHFSCPPRTVVPLNLFDRSSSWLF